MSLLLLIVVLLVLFGGGGWYGYNRFPDGGPYIGGGIGLIVLILVVLLLVGRIHI